MSEINQAYHIKYEGKETCTKGLSLGGQYMEELSVKLNNIGDSYFDFVRAVLGYVNHRKDRIMLINSFLEENPKALSSDVLDYIANQADFMCDSIV